MEDAVLKTNDNIKDTKIEVDKNLGQMEVEVKGATLTAAILQEAEDQKLEARLSVNEKDAESLKKYSELPENNGKEVSAFNIAMTIADTESNLIIGEDEIESKTLIQMTISIPAKYQGRELKMYYINEEGMQETLNYVLDETGTKLRFVINALGDFTMVAGECAENQHTYGERKIIKTATCVMSGAEEQICTKCGKITSIVIPKKAHAMSSWITTKAATALTEGTSV